MQNLNTKAIAHTKLTQDVDRRDTAMRVEDINILPAVPFRATIQNEIIEVHLVSGHTISKITRGLEGTKPASYIRGTAIIATWTDGMIAGISTNVKQLDQDIDQHMQHTRFLRMRGMSERS